MAELQDYRVPAILPFCNPAFLQSLRGFAEQNLAQVVLEQE